MEYGRCVELINQADGNPDEKLDCARSGLWGNQPLYDFRNSYSQVPIYAATTATPADMWADFVLPKRKVPGMKKCGCGCNGSNPASPSGPLGAAVGGSFGASLGGSNIGFNYNLSGLLLLILFVMMIWKKGR